MTRPMRKAFLSRPAAAKLYVDDVFSAYTYTGNGGTQTINNGIDLAGKGGLVWVKARSGTYGAADHYLFDTLRGADIFASSNATYGQGAFSVGTSVSFTATGASIGSSPYVNDPSTKFSALIFKKAAKFFDVVVYLGDGTNNRKIAHSISAAPGFVVTKNISGTGDWNSFHRSATGDLKLNLSDAQAGSKAIIPDADADTFTVSGVANSNGNFYVAYLFAHDPSVDGLIQCGSFTTDSSGSATVNLGWEPQWLLVKNADGSNYNWVLMDSARGWTVAASSNEASLHPNTSSSEIVQSFGQPTSTGFKASAWNANQTIVYMAIRRPNKPPTSGTKVYNAIARPGNGVANASVTGVGFSPDLAWYKARSADGSPFVLNDRLRGNEYLLPYTTQAGMISSAHGFPTMLQDGAALGKNTSNINSGNSSGATYINHFFSRAPGFFDVVCSSGFNPGTPINHSLKAAPEIVIVKIRNDASAKWMGAVNDGGNIRNLSLNTNGAGYLLGAPWATYFSSTTIDPAGIRTDTGGSTTGSSMNAVAYLFATLPGISKVGSYAGNGTSQTINCGFATGARFVLIKRTDAAGDWYVWDSVRGIVAANDPHLSLNTTAAEVTTDDSVDPDASGFIVNQVAATNINVSGASYIFLAIA